MAENTRLRALRTLLEEKAIKWMFRICGMFLIAPTAKTAFQREVDDLAKNHLPLMETERLPVRKDEGHIYEIACSRDLIPQIYGQVCEGPAAVRERRSANAKARI
jgi:hypothetical protein